jgi:hypothetical protein
MDKQEGDIKIKPSFAKLITRALETLTVPALLPYYIKQSMQV